MKRNILFLAIIILNLNVTAQSSWGILGKATGELLEGTSKKREWRTLGKVLQTAGDMQYNLDKTRIENEKTYNYNINTSNSQNTSGSSNTNMPENVIIEGGQYYPEEGYAWVNTFEKNDLRVEKIDLSIDDKVERLNIKALEALENGNLSESIIYSTQSLNLKPSWVAYFWRILSNYTLNNYDNSLKDLDLILNYFTDEYYDLQFILLFEIRGLIYMNRGELDKAIFNFNKVLEIDCPPEDCDEIKSETYSNRANVKFGLNDYDGALDDCDKAAILDPSNKCGVFTVKGLIYTQKEDYNNALYYFSESIKYMSTSVVDQGQYPILYTNKATAEYALKDYRAAMVDTNKAIENDFKYAKAYYIRGLSKIELGITESACSDFRKALEFGIVGAKEELDKYCNY